MRQHLVACLLGTFALSANPREARAGEGDVPESMRPWVQHWENVASRKFEIGPWLGWTAGVEQRGPQRRDVFSLNGGLDVTVLAGLLGNPLHYGGDFELRIGSWLGFDSLDRFSGEGGVTMLLTQTEHAQWGTFGVRAGAGYGADRATHLVATLTGGVRYVPDRIGQGSPGSFAQATGVRIVATVRHVIDPVETTAIVFGIEFEPTFFLPPYSLRKWGGAH